MAKTKKSSHIPLSTLKRFRAKMKENLPKLEKLIASREKSPERWK